MAAEIKLDFKEITKVIYTDFAQHEKNIKQLCLGSSVITLNEFYDGYKKEVSKINSEITPSKDRPSIADFQEIFAAFEEYPKNLPKPKRIAHKQLQRMNSTLFLADSSSFDNIPKDTLSSSNSLPTIDECHHQSAGDIYKNFLKCQQKLMQFMDCDGQKDVMVTAYVGKLQQLNTFARQLEKLLSDNCEKRAAFNAEEEQTLQQLVLRMEELNYIHNNAVVENQVTGNILARLEVLVEVLAQALISVNCYNNAT